MNNFRFNAITLNENEQIVFAEQARILPSMSDIVFIAVLAPTLMLVPWLIIHRLFRRSAYLITTQRVLLAEPQAVIGEIGLADIVKFRSTRRSLLIIGSKSRLWLPRSQDAWRFETIVQRASSRQAL